MIIVKPSKDILQLNKGFRFERNSSAFDEEGNLFLPHNARFLQGKFGKALFVEEGTENYIPRATILSDWNHYRNGYDGVYNLSPFIEVAKIVNKSGRCGLSKSNIPVRPPGERCQSAYFKCVSRAGTSTLRPGLYRYCTEYSDRQVYVPWEEGVWQRVHFVDNYTTSYNITLFMVAFGTDNTLISFDTTMPQVEPKPYPTSFIDGTRSPEIVTIPVNTISPTGGQWDHYVYVNDMARRQVAGQTPTLFHIPRQDGGMGIRVCHAEDSANWKLQTMDDTNDITEVGAPDTLTPDGWHRFTVKWTEAEAKLLIDGVVAETIANPALPSVFASEAFIGSYDGQKDFLNTLHDDIRVSSIARDDADDLADYQADQPLPTDQYTIYKQSFDSPNDMYVRQGFVL